MADVGAGAVKIIDNDGDSIVTTIVLNDNS